MLILSRRVGESICIGDDIRIEVCEIRGSNVRVGITAPPQVEVHRHEVYERIQEEKRRDGRQGQGVPLPVGSEKDRPI